MLSDLKDAYIKANVIAADPERYIEQLDAKSIRIKGNQSNHMVVYECDDFHFDCRCDCHIFTQLSKIRGYTPFCEHTLAVQKYLHNRNTHLT